MEDREYHAPAPEFSQPGPEFDRDAALEFGTLPPEFPDRSTAEPQDAKGRRRTLRKWLPATAAATLAVFLCVRFGAAGPAAANPAIPEPVPAAESVTPPAEAEPDALTDAERLVAIGTWKNSAESEWVHFSADGTGWWYDGTYFGCMAWEEGADGVVAYEASMAYLGPGSRFIDDHVSEKEGDCLHSARESGNIDLLAEEDRFICPGLRFGEGAYLPDDTPIDASVTDGIVGKTVGELLSGTTWHMAEYSDLGIPVAPSLEGGKPEVYTDLIYVQSMDFAVGVLCLATRDDGLLWREDWTVVGEGIYGDAADTLDVPYTLGDGEERAKATFDIYVDITYGFFSDLHPGDVEYNNMHFLWGRQIGPEPTEVYLLITSAAVRLGIGPVDLYPDNYTLLAPGQ